MYNCIQLYKNVLRRKTQMEDRKVFLNKHTNLLELQEHMYPLLDVDTPADLAQN